jgi:hypothetical protein
MSYDDTAPTQHEPATRQAPEGHAANDTPKPETGLDLPENVRVEMALDSQRRRNAAWDARTPVTLAERFLYAQQLANAELLPVAYRKKPANVLLAMELGAALGLEAIQSLTMLNVVEGKPSLGAEGMRALVLRAGHEVWEEEGGPAHCTMAGKRRDSERVYTATFTLDDAVNAGLCVLDPETGRPRSRSASGKPLPWEQYPRAMMRARATSELCRLAFPDVLSGVSYTPEELTAGGADVVPLDQQGVSRAAALPALEQHRVTAAPRTIAQRVVEGELGVGAVLSEPAQATAAAACMEPLPGDRRCTREPGHDGKHAFSARRHTELVEAERQASPLLATPAGAAAELDVPTVLDEKALDDAEHAAADEVLAEEKAEAELVRCPECGNTDGHAQGCVLDPLLHVVAEDAPQMGASRAELEASLLALAEREGKTVAQLTARWSIANRKTISDATDAELAAFLSSRS